MDFNDLTSIKEHRFKGFKTMSQLMLDDSVIPDAKGVYMVLTPKNAKPKFLKVGTGGHFKDKNPNVSYEELVNNWVDDTCVVYIGKAGSINGGATLRSRLKQYLRFGQGKKVGHWGGRLIWQLSNSSNLLFCWMPTPDHDPRQVEVFLLNKFFEQNNKLPFANLTM